MTPEVSQEQITVSESECYEITHIREKSGFAAGVLVAVSIPIFTAQLSKARLATNQANARAAKAAAVAAYLTDDTVRSVTYTTASGTDTPTSAAIASKLQLSDTIPSWTTGNTVTGAENLGNTVYTTWCVSVDASGKILGYYATK